MSDELGAWHDFFVTTAQIAGLLLGLLFVAVSIRSSGARQPQESAHAGWRHLVMNRFAYRSEFDALTTQTYVMFVYALGAGLVMLIPAGMIVNPAIVLALIALLGLVETTYPLFDIKRMNRRPGSFELLWRFGLPEVCTGLLFLGAVLLLTGVYAGFDLVALAEMLLLFGGARNTWDLFLTTGIEQG